MGYFENAVRAGFVLAPIGLVLIIGMIFLIRGNFSIPCLTKVIWTSEGLTIPFLEFERPFYYLLICYILLDEW